MLTDIKNEYKKHPFFSVVAIINFVLLLFLIILIDSDSTMIDKGIFIVLLLTLFTVLWYTIETHKMRLIQHREYIESKKPLLSVRMENGDPAIFGSFFCLTNHKPLSTTAYVYADMKLEDKDCYISGHYNGKILWQIQPSYSIRAPVSIVKAVLGSDFRDENACYVNFLSNNINKKLTLNIRVECESDWGEKSKTPNIKYHYDFNRRDWVLDVDA